MTRNDMVNKLGEHFIKNFWDLIEDGPYNFAEKVLQFLEDEGMEPPSEIYQNIDRNGYRQPNSNNGDYTNHWETDKEVEWKKKNET
jgi:hypothetical protein